MKAALLFSFSSLSKLGERNGGVTELSNQVERSIDLICWCVLHVKIRAPLVMRAWITPEQSLTIQRSVASFKIGTSRSLRVFQRMLCPFNLGSKPMSCHTPVLCQGNPPLHQSLGPLENFPLGLTSRRKEVTTDAGLGRSVRGQTSVRLLVKPGAMSAYQPRWSQVTLPSQVG